MMLSQTKIEIAGTIIRRLNGPEIPDSFFRKQNPILVQLKNLSAGGIRPFKYFPEYDKNTIKLLFTKNRPFKNDFSRTKSKKKLFHMMKVMIL